MRTIKGQTRTAMVMAAIAVAVARAAAQESPEHRSPARIVVSLPDRKLAIVQDGRVLRVYATAVGARVSPSPAGTFTVITRIPNPTWYHPGKVVPPGKDNPLGTRWLGLSLKGFGIHGTNSPRSIGRAASHGCIRLRNRDIEELFELVRIGDVVELLAERNEEAEQIFAAPALASAAVIVGGGE